jgi:hypothetical protein
VRYRPMQPNESVLLPRNALAFTNQLRGDRTGIQTDRLPGDSGPTRLWDGLEDGGFGVEKVVG